jgi:hypothetical protein
VEALATMPLPPGASLHIMVIRSTEC